MHVKAAAPSGSTCLVNVLQWYFVLLSVGCWDFDVLLTVHLSIILVINQLNAQNLVL